jgi:hypothetical protein
MLYADSVTDGNAVIYQCGGEDDWGNWHIQPLTTAEQAENANPWESMHFYSWQTGEDEWNKLTVLQDAENEFVAFDAPLRLTFDVAEDDGWNNDDHADQTFGTEFDGFSLHLPWEPVENDDEDDDDMDTEWRPVLNLKDSHLSGLLLTDMAGMNYVIKGVEEELAFNEVPEAEWTDEMIALEIVEVDEPTVGDTLDADIDEIFGNGSDFDWVKPTDTELEVIKSELIEAD